MNESAKLLREQACKARQISSQMQGCNRTEMEQVADALDREALAIDRAALVAFSDRRVLL